MSEVSNKFSTTQVVGALTMIITIYNAYANNTGKPLVQLSQDELLALGALSAPVIGCAYMMWRRVQKSALKWGFLK